MQLPEIFRYLYHVFGVSYMFGVENVFFLLLQAQRNVVTSCLPLLALNQADETGEQENTARLCSKTSLMQFTGKDALCC